MKSLGKENYQKMAEKKINKNEESITYKDKTFPLTTKCYLFFGSMPYIFIDYEKEEILKFNPQSIGINARFLDMLLTTSKRGIIGQLMHSLNLDMKTKTEWTKMISPIVIFVVGAVIGYLIGSPTPLKW